MPQFTDKAVIYASKEDGCWIAHTLRTDQIGTGDCVVEALADVIKAVDEVVALADQDASVAVFRRASPRVCRMAQAAAKLPKEIYEIAHRRARGTWPKEIIEPAFKAKRKKFLAEMTELSMA